MQGFGMFGPDPYQARMAQEASALEEIQAIDQGGPSTAVGILSNRGFGRIRDALGGEDPMMARGNKMKAIVEKLRQAGIDMSDPEAFYPAMIKELSAAGLNNEAMAMADKYQKDSLESAVKGSQAMKYRAEATKALSEKQPELVRLQNALKEASKRGDEKAMQQIAEQIRKITMQDTVTITEGEGNQIREVMYTKDGRRIVSGAPRNQRASTEVNINDRKGADAVASINTERAKGLATDMRAVSEFMPTLQEMGGIIRSGNYNQGITAPVQTAMQRALMAAGVLSEERIKQLSNTELIKAYMMDLVLPKMKLLGGSDSNEELKKISESVAQNGMTPEAAKRLMEIYERKAKRVSKKYAKIFKGGLSAEAFAKSLIDFDDYSDVDAEIDAEEGKTKPADPAKRSETPAQGPTVNNFYRNGKIDLVEYEKALRSDTSRKRSEAQIQQYLANARKLNGG